MMSHSNTCSFNNKVQMGKYPSPSFGNRFSVNAVDDFEERNEKQQLLNEEGQKDRGKDVGLASVTGSRFKGTMLKKITLSRKARFMNFQNIFILCTILVILGAESSNGLKCHMCGQYNEGVGSITPCLNYSDQNATLYLKDCPKKSEKFCVKYVSELSTVRDCATECVEKEVWETHTYCCDTDGCNGSNNINISNFALVLPVLYMIGSFFADINLGMMRR